MMVLRMMYFILLHHTLCPCGFPQERQKLWLPKDDLRDSSSWESPPLVLLRDIHSKFLTQYDWKEFCAQSQSQVNVRSGVGWSSQSQVNIGARTPRIVSLTFRIRFPSHFHSLTDSLRLPLCGMRVLHLSPMLMLLPLLLSLKLLNRSCFIGNTSGTLSLSTWDHVRRNS
jgi:hypothetical protein